MLSFCVFEDNGRGVIPPNPCHYVQMAEIALICGNRPEARALVTLAYLAFDLMLAECGEVTSSGRVSMERSS